LLIGLFGGQKGTQLSRSTYRGLGCCSPTHRASVFSFFVFYGVKLIHGGTNTITVL